MARSESFDDKKLQRALRKAPERLNIELRKGFGRVLSQFNLSFARSNLSKGYSRGGSTATGVYVRSGSLRRSLMMRVTGETVASLEGVTGFVDPRAAMIAGVHEFGATIRPVRAKKLAIPMDAVMGPSGIPRISPREVIAQGGYVTRSGIFDAAGQLMYLRRDEVVLKPKLGFNASWKAFHAKRMEILSASVEAAIK